MILSFVLALLFLGFLSLHFLYRFLYFCSFIHRCYSLELELRPVQFLDLERRQFALLLLVVFLLLVVRIAYVELVPHFLQFLRVGIIFHHACAMLVSDVCQIVAQLV